MPARTLHPALAPEAAGRPSACEMPLTLQRSELEEVFCRKYGEPGRLGPNPALWRRWGYYLPDEFYETLLAGLVGADTHWLDVGCGRDLLPHNPSLAQILSQRCARLVGLDPGDNVLENGWVHEAVQGSLQDHHPQRPYDLVTLRMVAEHITDPQRELAALRRLTRPKGHVVVYTVHQCSPTAVLARLVPFRLHHAIKRVLWRTQERDTFPTAYRMNTHGRLTRLFAQAGFRERYFANLADCRVFARFRILHRIELSLWRLLCGLGLGYPECCLLAVYQRQDA